MDTSDSTSIPDGFKRCRKGTECVHPNGPNLPATLEYFCFLKHRGKLRNICRKCESRQGCEWAKAHPDKHLKRVRTWQQNNLDKHKKQHADGSKRYRRNHPDKARELKRVWRKNNPIKNHDAIIKNTHVRRAKQKKLPSTLTVADWHRCLDYFDYRCAVCGRDCSTKPLPFEDNRFTLAQSHIQPLSKGGGYTPDNIIPLCHGDNGCNNRQGDKNFYEWLDVYVDKKKAKSIVKRISEYMKSIQEIQ